MGKRSRQKQEKKTQKARESSRARARAVLNSLKIPHGVSIIAKMEEAAKQNHPFQMILQCLKQTVEHFKVPLDVQRQAMESIQRVSILVHDYGSLEVLPVQGDSSEDVITMNTLMDMVEYFHKIAEPAVEKMSPK